MYKMTGGGSDQYLNLGSEMQKKAQAQRIQKGAGNASAYAAMGNIAGDVAGPTSATGGVLSGAGSGAAAGAMFGPYGAAIGGVVGGVAGGLRSKSERKKANREIESQKHLQLGKIEGDLHIRRASAIKSLAANISRSLT